jgi:hypothetical protein
MLQIPCRAANAVSSTWCIQSRVFKIAGLAKQLFIIFLYVSPRIRRVLRRQHRGHFTSVPDLGWGEKPWTATASINAAIQSNG